MPTSRPPQTSSNSPGSPEGDTVDVALDISLMTLGVIKGALAFLPIPGLGNAADALTSIIEMVKVSRT